MSRLQVVPIVAGEGEFACVRILLERVWREVLGGDLIEVLQPIRGSRGQIVKRERLQNFVRLALRKLQNPPVSSDPALVLILIDADEDCPKDLAPRLLAIAREVYPPANVSCVLANVEYETWFVAAAEALGDDLDLAGDQIPRNRSRERPGSPATTRAKGRGAAGPWINLR